MFWTTTPAPAPSKPAAAAPSSSQSSSIIISRNIHLSSYLNHSVLKPSTRKVSHDDTIYETVFQTTNGYALILRVTLPHNVFRTPIMALHGVHAQHNWIDTQMKVVGYSPISSDKQWKHSKMKLGDAVYAVIQHFQLNPPTIIEIIDVKLKQFQKNLADRTSAPTPPAPTTSTTTSSTTTTTRPTGSTSHPPIHQKEKKPNPKPIFDVSDEEIEALIPSIPPSFPTIESMSSSEIKRLMRTQSQLDSFIEQTNEVQTLREIKLGIEQSNVDMAKSNLQHETQLEEMQSEILALEMEVTSQLQHYNTLHARRVSMTEPPSVQTVISEMNVAKKEAYRLSESLADRWIESGGGSSSTGSGGGSAEDVGDFVKQFMEMRTLYHCRAAKIERLENSTATLQKKDSIFPPLL